MTSPSVLWNKKLLHLFLFVSVIFAGTFFVSNQAQAADCYVSIGPLSGYDEGSCSEDNVDLNVEYYADYNGTWNGKAYKTWADGNAVACIGGDGVVSCDWIRFLGRDLGSGGIGVDCPNSSCYWANLIVFGSDMVWLNATMIVNADPVPVPTPTPTPTPPPPPTPTPPPLSPGSFSFSGNCSDAGDGDNEASLDWNSSSNATNYRIERRVWSTGSWNTAGNTGGTSFSEDWRNDEDIYYRVYATNSSGETQASPSEIEVCEEVGGPPPPPPPPPGSCPSGDFKVTYYNGSTWTGSVSPGSESPHGPDAGCSGGDCGWGEVNSGGAFRAVYNDAIDPSNTEYGLWLTSIGTSVATEAGYSTSFECLPGETPTPTPPPPPTPTPSPTPTPTPTPPLGGSHTVQGYVYQDLNTSTCCGGIKDSEESGIVGETVTLTRQSDGSVVAVTTTDDNGFYQFTNILDGAYRVIHQVPSGYTRTTDDSVPFSLP